MAENTGNIGFEETLWKAADKLRGSMDASEYKHVVLGLIFLKYISDKFETKFNTLVEEGAGFEEDRDEYEAENIFWVPKEARWTFIKDNAKDSKIGQYIDDAMILIEKENTSLKGVLDKCKCPYINVHFIHSNNTIYICYGGRDLSSSTDITAFVLVFPPLDEDDKYVVLPHFWIPEDSIDLRVRRDHVNYDVWEKQGFLMTTEGNVVHYGFIETFIEELGMKYNIREIAFDRWGAVQMTQNLENLGFTVVPFGQGFKDMSPPTKELMKLTLEEKIAHGGHPVLRWMMDNIFIRTDPAGNIKADKEKSTEKIDGAVATIMALDRAIRRGGETGNSVYDGRGLFIL